MADWKNRTIFTGDNLDVMRGLPDGMADLIYLDPPFNSNRDYAAPIGSKAAGAHFKDTWTLDDVDLEWWGEISESNPALYAVLDAARHAGGRSAMSYLAYMGIRILEMRRILNDTGTIYLHCDPTMSHYLKMCMDAVFDRKNFRNEIVWRRTMSKNALLRDFGRNHDTILRYGKTNRSHFSSPRIPYGKTPQGYRRGDDGRYFALAPVHAPGSSGGSSGSLAMFRGKEYPPPPGATGVSPAGGWPTRVCPRAGRAWTARGACSWPRTGNCPCRSGTWTRCPASPRTTCGPTSPRCPGVRTSHIPRRSP